MRLVTRLPTLLRRLIGFLISLLPISTVGEEKTHYAVQPSIRLATNDIDKLTEELQDSAVRKTLVSIAGYRDGELEQARLGLRGDHSTFDLTVKYLDGSERDRLLATAVTYCRLRRQGLSREFVLEHLQPAKPGRPDIVLEAFQAILPGIVSAEMQTLTDPIPAFPFFVPTVGKRYVVADSEVAILCSVSTNDGKQSARTFLIDKTDLSLKQDKALCGHFLALRKRYLAKDDVVKNIYFWSEWAALVRKLRNRQWMSPGKLNPDTIFD
jgi:hypothetical protein